MEVAWSQPYEEGTMHPGRFLAILGLILMTADRSAAQDYDLQLRNDRNAFKNTTDWIYDDLAGLKLDPREMAKIERLEPGSTADRAGSKPGDEIMSMDGQPLLSIADLQWVLSS